MLPGCVCFVECIVFASAFSVAERPLFFVVVQLGNRFMRVYSSVHMHVCINDPKGLADIIYIFSYMHAYGMHACVMQIL